MSHSPGENVAAQAPINPETRNLLIDFNVSPERIRQHEGENRSLIMESLDDIQIAIDMSRPEAMDQVPGVHETPDLKRLGAVSEAALSKIVSIDPAIAKTKETRHKIRDYDHIRRDPAKKLEHDSALVYDFLRKLGPTNELRSTEGIDASFELGRIKRLLERDHDVLSAKLKADYLAACKESGVEPVEADIPTPRPELRMSEALVAEELALLWTPQAVQDAAQSTSAPSEMIANPEDPNTLSDEQIEKMSEEQRWVAVGMKQCAEAAKLFAGIFMDSRTPREMRIEAFSRQYDMRIRGLQLKRAAVGEDKKAAVQERIEKLAGEHLEFLIKMWNRPNGQAKLGNGKLFESIVLGKERVTHIQEGSDSFVRLAMPREDEIHEEIRPFINRDRQKVNLSSDVIVEDINGKTIHGYQAKAWERDNYRATQRENQREGGLVYPEDLIEMRFLDTPGYEALRVKDQRQWTKSKERV